MTGYGRIAAEQRLLDVVVEERGMVYAEENAELLLTQARLVGAL